MHGDKKNKGRDLPLSFYNSPFNSYKRKKMEKITKIINKSTIIVVKC